MSLIGWIAGEVLGLGTSVMLGVALLAILLYYKKFLGIADIVSSLLGKAVLGVAAIGFFIVIGSLLGWIDGPHIGVLLDDAWTAYDVISGPAREWLGRASQIFATVGVA